MEQWHNILAVMLSLIGLINALLPDKQIKQLAAEVQIISNSFEDYTQKDLAHQELFIEKEDMQL